MKTTDLIPLILYQLVDGDKYGYEIVKQIEDATSGSVVIKQPTLYSVLKKLEQGKFISSYWQDSEIGGKRHYYKLTDNGRTQLDTYPSFAQLVTDINQEDEIKMPQPKPMESTTPFETINGDININNNSNINSKDCKIDESLNKITDEEVIIATPIDISVNIKPINIASAIEPIISNSESEMPCKSTENNEELNIDPTDNIVEVVDINDNVIESPTRINIFDAIEPAGNIESATANLTDTTKQTSIQQTNQEEDVNINVTNKEVVEEVVKPVVNNKLYSKLTPNEDLINLNSQTSNEECYYPTLQQTEQVKYLNYVDLNTDLMSVKRKKALNKHIQKMILSCSTLLIMFVISIVFASKYSFGKLYYVGAIVVCLIIILYPIILIKNMPEIRLKHCSVPFRYSISRDFFVKLSLFLSLFIAIFAFNLMNVDNIKAIFKLSNFGNFIAPIMFSFGLILDFVYSVLIYKNYTK